MIVIVFCFVFAMFMLTFCKSIYVYISFFLMASGVNHNYRLTSNETASSNTSVVGLNYSFCQLLPHKIFSCHTISETSHSKCKTTHQISKTRSYFSAFDSVFNCIKHFFQNTLPKTQKSNRKCFPFPNTTVGLQIYKMINLGSNVIVYILKHCVFKCLT